MIRTQALAIAAVGLLVAGGARAQRRADLSIPDVAAKDAICFALYTVHDGTLKLTAQLYPLADTAPRTVRLEVERDGGWVEVAIERPSRTHRVLQAWGRIDGQTMDMVVRAVPRRNEDRPGVGVTVEGTVKSPRMKLAKRDLLRTAPDLITQ